VDPTDVMNRRIPAFLIDFAILALVLLGSGLRFGFTETTQLIDAESICDARTTGLCLPQPTGAMTIDHRGWVTLAVAPILWLLWGLIEGVTGASPGKWIMGLRVVTADGAHAGVARSLTRWTIGLLESFPWVTPMMMGILFAANAPGRQRLGDRLANTFVVHKGAVGAALPAPDAMNPVRAWPVALPDPNSQPPPPRATDAVGQTMPPPNAADAATGAPEPEPGPHERPQEIDMPAGVRWDEGAGYYIYEDPDRRLWWNAASDEWLPLSK